MFTNLNLNKLEITSNAVKKVMTVWTSKVQSISLNHCKMRCSIPTISLVYTPSLDILQYFPNTHRNKRKKKK